MRHVVNSQEQEAAKPLSEPVFLILTSLAGEPKHGYALLRDIEQLSEGRVVLSTGTLYGALRRLLADGLIDRFEQADKTREKQAYRLTATGRAQLKTELDRMQLLCVIARGKLNRRTAI